jgi:hypothetical protein
MLTCVLITSSSLPLSLSCLFLFFKIHKYCVHLFVHFHSSLVSHYLSTPNFIVSRHLRWLSVLMKCCAAAFFHMYSTFTNERNYWIFFFYGTGVWTQGLTLDRQVLYLLSHASSPETTESLSTLLTVFQSGSTSFIPRGSVWETIFLMLQTRPILGIVTFIFASCMRVQWYFSLIYLAFSELLLIGSIFW